MIKPQHVLPLIPHTLKALHKGTELATGNKMPGPENVRTRAETLNDSLEEIGVMFSEKMERKNKLLNRRSLQSNLLRNRGAVDKIAHLNQMFALLDNSDAGRADEQLAQLREAIRQTPPPDTETLLRQSGGDPARCDLLLQMVEQQAAEAGDGELVAAVKAHLDSLNQAHGNVIRAGKNTAHAIAGQTRDPQQKQWMRNLYYDCIVHQQSAMVMLDMLLEHAEIRHLIPRLRTLQRALADDIAALAPSISVGALARIQRGLRDAGQISQTIADSSAFLTRLKSTLPEIAMDGITLTRRALQISHNGAYHSDYQHLCEDIIGAKPEHLPLFYCGLFPLMNGLPHSLWQESDHRKTALVLLRGIITDVTKTEQQQRLRNGE